MTETQRETDTGAEARVETRVEKGTRQRLKAMTGTESETSIGTERQ